MLKIKTTERGFRYAEFIDRYGSQCSIQESSLATEAAIWLGVDVPFPEFRPHGPVDSTRMHLTQEMARDLIPLLELFVEKGEF